MIRDAAGTLTLSAERPWLTPRNLLLAGAAVNLLGIVLATAGEQLVPVRVVVILTGLVLTLVGINHRLRSFVEDLEGRAITAAYLAFGSFDILLAYLACSEEWDTFRLALGIFVGVGLAGALLCLVPMLLRRAIIVLLILFHFGGILTAVFSVAPPNAANCWLTGFSWTYIYRPYLQFMYLNNAYHFYSPEPGPATQLWFRVSYDDPAAPPHWFQFPRPEEFPSRLSYQRQLAMCDTTMAPRPGGPPPEFFNIDGPYVRRYQRAWLKDPHIPYLPGLQMDKRDFAYPDLAQYREPSDLAKRYISSYARHVAHDPRFHSPDRPDAPVRSVKVYRVVHNFLSPKEMAEKEISPDEPALFVPVYVGEFDPEGQLLDPDDPLLYWVVPILREADESGKIRIKDFVAIHAGDKHSVFPND
jgi:hypothetical protein